MCWVFLNLQCVLCLVLGFQTIPGVESAIVEWFGDFAGHKSALFRRRKGCAHLPRARFVGLSSGPDRKLGVHTHSLDLVCVAPYPSRVRYPERGKTWISREVWSFAAAMFGVGIMRLFMVQTDRVALGVYRGAT